MSGVIACLGLQTEKMIDGQRSKVTAFVGADREGEFAQLGIGFLSESDSGFWGLVIPHCLIHSWRAMKILERLLVIHSDSLAGCYYAACEIISESDQRCVDRLTELLGGHEEMQAIRDQVLRSTPSDEELDSMLRTLSEKGVAIDCHELQQEIQAERIGTSALIERLIFESEQKRAEFQRREDEAKQPLPREESLAAFFEDLQIGNFIIGGGIGGYGIAWGHIEMSELDRIAKQDSFSPYLPDGHFLEHTTLRPDTRVTDLAPGMTTYTTSFGEIERPKFSTTDGTIFTFLFAKFRDERFYIKVKIVKPDNNETEEVHTIDELREMIGPMPAKPAQQKTVLQKLAAWIGW